MKPGSLTPKQIAKLLDTLEVLEKIGEAVRAHAVELAHAGTDIPGYEACFTNARRMWVDEEKANITLEELGLAKRERYSVELLSPAQAEKLLRSKKLWPKKPRGGAGDDFTDPLKSVVGYTETKPSIRKASSES
jgi:hypothetical protein